MRMTRLTGNGLVAVAVTVLVLASGSIAWSQTLQQRIEALESKVESGNGSLSQALGLDIHALLSTTYTYSFNRPSSDRLPFRVIDKKDNTFALNDAALFVSRMKEDESFGFMLALDFGDTAEFTASDWDGTGVVGDISEENNSFELREAYLTYDLPFADATLKAGKFATLLGYEVLKTHEDFNPNISHSILFGFSIPFTHTGLLLSAPLGEMASFDIGIVNGWDNVEDNNDNKTLIAGLGLSPTEMLSIYVAGSYGGEQNSFDDPIPGAGAGSKRGVVTANATLTVSDQLSFAVDSVYGNETDIVSTVSGTEDADWYGVAGYAMVNLDDKLSLALRGEVFDDPDGARGFNATVWEITPTLSYRFSDHLLARLEYRHDEASKAIFEVDDRSGGSLFDGQSGSNTVAGELILAF